MKEEDRSLSVSQMIDYLIKKFSEKKNDKIAKSLASVKDYKIIKKALEEFTQ
ncbi:hypothetical protein [Bacteroides finegoldii]|nr:hypothetical protein [Bacteroides finegoldii]